VPVVPGLALRDRLVSRAARAASRVVADPRASRALVRTLSGIQRTRELVDDLQSAMWHLGALPSRRDVHHLFRKTALLSRKIVELERELARLERIVESNSQEPGGS